MKLKNVFNQLIDIIKLMIMSKQINILLALSMLITSLLTIYAEDIFEYLMPKKKK